MREREEQTDRWKNRQAGRHRVGTIVTEMDEQIDRQVGEQTVRCTNRQAGRLMGVRTNRLIIQQTHRQIERCTVTHME